MGSKYYNLDLKEILPEIDGIKPNYRNHYDIYINCIIHRFEYYNGVKRYGIDTVHDSKVMLTPKNRNRIYANGLKAFGKS